MADFENKLRSLIDQHLHENRNSWVLKAKKEGKVIIGYTDTLVPKEIIHAAGMFPYRIIGTYDAGTPLAEAWRPPQMCQYIQHTVESLLRGELDILDGIVHSDWDDDARRFYDLCVHLHKPVFNLFLHMPHGEGPLSYKYFSEDIKRTIKGDRKSVV